MRGAAIAIVLALGIGAVRGAAAAPLPQPNPALDADASVADAGPAATSGGGTAPSEHDAFYAAMALAQRGHAKEATAAFEALAARAPHDLFADDALLEAARLAEEQLGDPVGAASIYERIVHDYPDSRTALRAEHRAAALRQGLGPDSRDADALTAWQGILAHFPTRGRHASVADAEALLARAPGFGQADEVAYWIAQQRVLEHDAAPALATFARLAHAKDPDLARRALRAQADLDVELGRWDDALALYQELRASSPGIGATVTIDDALDHLAREHQKARLAVGAGILVALLVFGALARLVRLAGSPGAAARAVMRPPTEVLFVAPLALIFFIAGQTEAPIFGHATIVLSSATVGIAWLVGAGLRASTVTPAVSVRRLEIIAWGVGGALAMLCTAYLTVHLLGLSDFIAHTVRYGTE